MTSYIAQRINTASGERIVYFAQLSLWSFLPRYALATLLLAAASRRSRSCRQAGRTGSTHRC